MKKEILGYVTGLRRSFAGDGAAVCAFRFP